MTPAQNRVFFRIRILLQKISNEFKKGEEKGEVPREFKQGREKKGGSSRDRARGAYMQGNTQNIPIVNMYLAVLRTQSALIDPQFAASSQGMHGQTPPLKRGTQRCIRPG